MATLYSRDARRLRPVHATICPHTGTACGPALVLLKKLEPALDLARASACVEDAFSISGVVETADCTRRCALGYHARLDEVRVYGDVDAADAGKIDAWAESESKTAPAEAAALVVARRMAGRTH